MAETRITVNSQMFAGVVRHDHLHPDDGGGWHVGHVDWYETLVPHEGKRIRVTIKVLDPTPQAGEEP